MPKAKQDEARHGLDEDEAGQEQRNRMCRG